MAAETSNLSLVTPTQGTLSGAWGDTVNNGITEYVDIAVAGTLTLNGDGAVTLANTVGDASSANIGSTTAQYAILRVTGTLTGTKVITAPSSSKTYTVINDATGGSVTVKASGQTGVTVAVGEKANIAFNGTDYVLVAGTATDGVATISFGSTGLTPSTATAGAVSVGGTLAVANGGTGITSFGSGVATFLGTPSSANLAAAVTDETGTGALVFANSPTLVTPALGTPASGTLSGCTVDGTNAVGFRAIPSAGAAKTGSYTLATTDVGEFVEVGSGGSITVPTSTFAAGDAVVIFNNNAGTSTITCSALTAYVGGTNTVRTSVTLAARGICNVLFVTPTLAVITGNVT